jgi:hypothetical protein
MEKGDEPINVATATIILSPEEKRAEALKEIRSCNEDLFLWIEQTAYYHLLELIDNYPKYKDWHGYAAITTTIRRPKGHFAKTKTALDLFIRKLQEEKLQEWFYNDELKPYDVAVIQCEWNFDKNDYILRVVIGKRRPCSFLTWY